MAKKEPQSLLEAITRIANVSYGFVISKYPFVKKYLEKAKNPKEEWSLYVTAAGLGYVLSKKESYPSEHNELIESVFTLKGLRKLVIDSARFIQDVYKNNDKLYPISIGFWILTRIKKGKPTIKEVEKFSQDIGELLDLTISEYESKKKK